MNQNEILKQIDDLIIETQQNCKNESDYSYELVRFYNKVQLIMENYEKVLEINHFKQTEI